MSSWPSRRLAATVSFLALVASGQTAIAAGAPDPVTTMANVVKDLGLQTQMPKDVTTPPAIPWSDVHWHIAGHVAELILWGAVAVGLGFALFALRDTFPTLSRRNRVKLDKGTALPVAAAVERMYETGDDADDLARRGLLAKAMHMLLLRSLTELRKRLDVTIADSLTSREILQHVALPESGRAALADLIQRVEFVHFGRQVAAPDDYGACRASYEALIGAMGTPPATPA